MNKSWLLFCLPALAAAAVWPESAGPWKRVEAAPAVVSERAIWDELGLKEAERATYENAGRKWTATGYRLQDPTAAMAAFQWQRPAAADDSKFTALAAATPKGVIAAYGNYLFVFDDYRPAPEEFAALTAGLREFDSSPLPAFVNFVPDQGRVKGGDRYIAGPAALEKFSPGIPPAVAAFSMGAEAQSAAFRSPKGEMRMTVFNYPTPQIAMAKLSEFQKVPGVMAKRSGPLVAVIVSPADSDAAERLLSKVRYEAQVTLAERMPTRRDNIGNLIINAFVLIGILLGFSLVGGLAVGGARVFRRLWSKGPEPEAMITLHLQNR